MLQSIKKWLQEIFAAKPKLPIQPELPMQPLPVVPAPIDTGLSKNPAYNQAKKHEGEGENKSKFVAYLAAFWPKTGLNYKTIIGSSVAWCGLFIVAMNSETGLNYIKKGAGARNWALYGQKIEWKTQGIPRGAVMHLNHDGNCSSKSSNHVTFSDGDCTAEELLKAKATVPGFGGNQQNTVNRTMYDVKKICAVRWPEEITLPSKVTKSVNCSSGSKAGNVVTR